MSNDFPIFDVAKEAYRFVGREWRYLAWIGVFPMAAQAATSLFVAFARSGASAVEAYVWGLPASALFAVFVFSQTRLLMLGERRPPLDGDPVRQRALQASVLTGLLINMGFAAVSFVFYAGANAAGKGDTLLVVAAAFLTGAMIWALRLSFLPLLAALDLPFTPFLKRVGGAWFSIRLIGLGIVVLFPVVIAFQIALVPLAPLLVKGDIGAATQAALILVSAPFSLAVAALLNAALACALKIMIGAVRAP